MDQQQALSLQWAFGFSSTISNGVADLTDKVVYVAAHTAIIYDRIEKQQTVLQGHCNLITCLCVSEDKQLIFTADAGEDAMVVIWEAASGQPIRTINCPHPKGVIAMDLSRDGQQLVLLSAASTDSESMEMEQEISLWDLTDEGSLETPVATGSVPAGDVQTCIHFSPEINSEIISNGKQRVYFWKTNLPFSKDFKYYSPPVSARDFKQSIGDFTVSVFIPGTTLAVTGTVDGDLVVWEEGHMIEPGSRPPDRRAVKILRIHFASISSLVIVDDYIVSGGADGNVRFYDAKLRLVAWFDDIDAGEVTSISFASHKMQQLRDSTEEHDKFMAPDFIVGTSKCKIVAVKSDSFEKLERVKSGELVMEGTFDSVLALATHPMRSEFVCAGSAGLLWLWNYSTKHMLMRRQFEKLRGCVLTFSPDGTRLAVGCTNGSLRILNPNTLEDVQAFRFTTGSVVQVAWSPDTLSIAVADSHNYVALITYGHGKFGDKWEYIGKYGTHNGRVSGLCFEGLGAQTRLFSVAEDGLMVEYDVPNCSVDGGIRLVSYADIGRAAAVPTAVCLAPPTQKNTSGGPLLITADNAFKFRTYDSATQTCKKTVLGPTYGGPLKNLNVFQTAGRDDHFLAYATPEKVIGLSLLPLDGDPSKAMGLIAHPGEITGMAVSYDGRRILTVGGKDSIVNMWGVDVSVLESHSKAEKQSNPYMSLIEGGEGGEFYGEMKDYFYYSQIHSQGEETTAPRQIDGQVVLAEVPNLMRALGYYPSEYEVADMLAELQGEAAEAGQPAPTHVDFTRFISLYVNHRPVFGVGKEQLQAAFAALGADPATGVLDAEDLIQAITQEGEPMSGAELEDCLLALCGNSQVDECLPPSLDSKQFAEEVLGFEDYAQTA